jgi:hypothetical protein
MSKACHNSTVRPGYVIAEGIGVRAAMRGHGNDRDGSRLEPPRLLREALREARLEAAERTGVVVDLRDAEIARLELLHDELDPVFAEIPAQIELFDRGISRGDTPRLWIDAVAHVEMGRDKRMYRFVQDSRFGRVVLAESNGSRDIAEAVTKYVARRMIDRERMLAGEETVRVVVPQRGRVVLAFLGGIACGIILLLAVVWITALQS